MIETKYNFKDIKAAVDAADFAQEAGYKDLCKEILTRLANELLNKEID